MDINDLLDRTWKIAWNHKILWGVGALSMALAILILPLAFAPMISIAASDEFPVWMENPLFLVGWLAIFAVWFLVTFLVSPWIQAALTLGALRAGQGQARLNFGELFSAGRAYYLRFLGVMAIFSGSLLLANLALSLLQTVGSLLTLGLASLCLTPLTFLLIPVMYVAMAWMELTEAAIVVRGLGVMDSFRHTWQLIRANKLPVVLLTLILYLGIGIVSSLFGFPLMLPFFAVPFTIMAENEIPRTILIISGLCLAAYLPIYTVLQGAVLAFVKAGWIVGYQQLTRVSEDNTPIQANA
jgi:hypothetical protein